MDSVPELHQGLSVGIRNRFPSLPFGPEIEGLPGLVLATYQKARPCMTANAFTACELVCRNILMHAAVEKGAGKGQTFESYVSFLQGTGYVTPPMKEWVDMIRRHGNRAAHELDRPDKARAESTIMFTAELLRLIYEMESEAKRYARPPG